MAIVKRTKMEQTFLYVALQHYERKDDISELSVADIWVCYRGDGQEGREAEVSSCGNRWKQACPQHDRV
jgi:hypothetical protein